LHGVRVEAKIERRFSARGPHFLPDFSAGEYARQRTYPSKPQGSPPLREGNQASRSVPLLAGRTWRRGHLLPSFCEFWCGGWYYQLCM